MKRFPDSMRVFVHLIVVFIAGVMLSACSKSETAADAQIVARIGPDVVTIQELENEIRLSNIQPERRKEPEVIRKLVGDLVARKMLVRRALTAKLDREPTVLLDLLRSKDVVLADAMAARAVNARLSALSSSDVEKYIQGNPLRFANRLILQVDQLIAPNSSSLQSAVEASKTAKSLDDVGQILTSMSVPFTRSRGLLNSGELPDEIASAFRNQGFENVLFVQAGQNGAFLKVVGQERRPLTGPAAEAIARQMIRSDLMKSEASMAAFTANLEASYVGEYAKIMAAK